MKKYILFFSLSLFLVSCGSTENPSYENTAGSVEKVNQESRSNDSSSNGSKTTKAECMQGCYMMWKANTGNKDRTPADMEKDCNNLCEAGQGMQNNDPASCEKSDGMLRDVCYSDIAEKTNAPKMCEKIKDELIIGSCYSKLAEKTKDVTICNNLKEGIMKNICIEDATKK